ncbi:MAG: Trp family transcriptional regulator [Candidatus Paceibacterota bacterium]
MDKKLDYKKFIILPPIGNYSSRKEWENICWRKILKSEELLNLLVTSDERHDLVMRVAAINGISAGKTYRKIGEELWLSPQTVSGIKKALSEKLYKSYKERSKTERKKKVYNSIPKRTPKKEWHEGTPRRTKYGTIYLP